MSYNIMNNITDNLHFNRRYRLCRCLRIPTKGALARPTGKFVSSGANFRVPSSTRAKSADFARQAHAFMREPRDISKSVWRKTLSYAIMESFQPERMIPVTESPCTDGGRYVPYAERYGNESIVYFTRDLSAEGLRKIYARVCGEITGKVAVKLHTGEQYGPNIIPREWVKALIDNELRGATIIETNTFYEGDRDTTEKHLKTLEINGWTFCPVDITDADGTADLPVNGKWFDHMSVGKTLPTYDSMVALTHFKGHTMGGFGGSNKNIGIGCADGKIGKCMIHARSSQDPELAWSVDMEELMERMCESTKATIDFFGKRVCYVNVMRNISVSCDCEGCLAEPVVTPDIGILASTDILAVDQACVDLIYALSEADGAAMRERIESRHGHRQLSYMQELHMGNRKYLLMDIDRADERIRPADAVEGVVPFVELPETAERRMRALAAAAAAEAAKQE